MPFTPQDRRIDSGKDFAKAQSPDFHKVYYKNNSAFLELLADGIDKKNPVIADYGGGNGILARQLIRMLNKRKVRCAIDIIDVDAAKKVPGKGVRFINANAMEYRRRNHYDYALSRFILHYFNEKERMALIKNVYGNLKPGALFLLISWAIDDEGARRKRRQILDIVERRMGLPKRAALRTDAIIGMCKKAGFAVARRKKFTSFLRTDDFYKNRFRLPESAVNSIIKETGIKGHKESQIGLLLKK